MRKARLIEENCELLLENVRLKRELRKTGLLLHARTVKMNLYAEVFRAFDKLTEESKKLMKGLLTRHE